MRCVNSPYRNAFLGSSELAASVAALAAQKDYVAAASRTRQISMMLSSSSSDWSKFGSTFCLVGLATLSDGLVSMAAQMQRPNDLPAAIEIIRTLLGSECMALANSQKNNDEQLAEARLSVLMGIRLIHAKVKEIFRSVKSGVVEAQPTEETSEGT